MATIVRGLRRLIRIAEPDVVLHQLTDLSTGNSESNAVIRNVGTRNFVDAALSAGVKKMVAQSVTWALRDGPLGWIGLE